MTFKKSNLYCLLIIIFFSNNVARVQSTTPIKMNLLNQLNMLNRLNRLNWFNFTKLERDKTQHIRVARDGDQPNVMQIVACATSVILTGVVASLFFNKKNGEPEISA